MARKRSEVPEMEKMLQYGRKMMVQEQIELFYQVFMHTMSQKNLLERHCLQLQTFHQDQ